MDFGRLGISALGWEDDVPLKNIYIGMGNQPFYGYII